MARSSGLRVANWFLTRRGRCRPRSRSVQPQTTIAGRLCQPSGLGSSRFVRHYSGNHLSSSGYSDVSLPPVPFRWPMHSARDDGGPPPPGCPIRTSSDRRVPAAPRGVSSRGHVLHRPQAPRHPPCAFDAVHSTPASCLHRSFVTSTPPRASPGPLDHRRHGVRMPVHVRVPPDARILHLVRCRWSCGESNPGPPPCKGGALPAKLQPPEPGRPRPGFPDRDRWAFVDSNHGPHPYQGCALTS